MLFTGEYEHTIDAKLRLAMPSEIRSRIDPERQGAAFYLAPGPNGAIWIWPERTFEQMAGAMAQSLLPDEDLLDFEEYLFPNSHRVELDKAGRIRLPERMLKEAAIESSVVILGVKDHLELRDPARWTEQRREKLARQHEIMLRARQALSHASRTDGAAGRTDQRDKESS